MLSVNTMPWRIVLAACLGMFAATSTGSTRSPFLPDIATDLSVSLPAVANLFGFTAVAWGISSFITGRASDRLGRRVFLVFSPLLLCIAMASVAFVQSYAVLVGIVVFSGLCCGAYTATAMAEVSIQTPLSHQGRALGYVMTGQSLTLLIGVPLSAWLGAITGWRGMHFVLAGLSLFAALAMFAALQKSAGETIKVKKSRSSGSLKRALIGPVTRLFLALIAERLCFGLATFYYASYLRTEYGIPINAVALPLVCFAFGNISGTFIGGQIADRFPYRRVSYASAIIAAGCIAIPWFSWQPGIGITVVLGALFAFFNGMARPPLLAALADVPVDVRGVVMGLNSSVASVGWLSAALIGGWLYAGIGFNGFSPVMAAMCVVAAAVVLPDSRMRQQQTN